jgi:hypothetical protein
MVVSGGRGLLEQIGSISKMIVEFNHGSKLE